LLVALLSVSLTQMPFSSAGRAAAQEPARDQEKATRPESQGPSARPMTIPIGIRVRGGKPEFEIRTLDLNVNEDGEPQTILYIRPVSTTSPITIQILFQDDLVNTAANEIKPLAEFIRQLPKGSRVMVAYVRSGTLDVRQKFTQDLEKAANALRIPMGLASAAPYNPYVEVLEALKRFDSQPSGRRAMLLVSDGLDLSRGIDSSSPAQSLDLQRAIGQAQKRSVAIYSFFVPSVTLNNLNNQALTANAQGSLQRLSDETGGKALFQGTSAPVSFDPFLRDLGESLDRQVALTYLSTHPRKGFHKIQIRSLTPGVDISYPAGYSN